MNLNTAYNILTYLSAFSVIVPLLIAIQKWCYFGYDGRCLTIYLIISLLTEIVLIYLELSEVFANILVNCFSLFEFIAVSLIFYFALAPKKLFKWFYWCGVSAISTVFIFSDIRLPTTVFNGFYIFVLILFALYYFYKETREVSVQRLADHYFFWFNTAFLIYFGFSFFIFLYEDFITNADRDVARVLWTFHLILNIIYYSILTVGIWKHSGKRL